MDQLEDFLNWGAHHNSSDLVRMKPNEPLFPSGQMAYWVGRYREERQR